jgi:hypothetical protein
LPKYFATASSEDTMDNDKIVIREDRNDFADLTYVEYADGSWLRFEYDDNGILIHTEFPDGTIELNENYEDDKTIMDEFADADIDELQDLIRELMGE